MKIFYYEGKNTSGKKIRGLLQAETKSFVAREIKNSGFFPVKIRVINSCSFTYILKSISYRIQTVDLAIFCEQLAVMLDAGVTITEALDALAKQINNRKLKTIIYRLIWQLKCGHSLADACKRYPLIFSEFFIHMIEAGELTGNLSDVLRKLSSYYFNIEQHNEKIKSAMIYPCILGIISLFVVYFVSTNVLPVYENIFEVSGAQLHKTTQLLMYVGLNMHKIIITLLITFIIFYQIWLKFFYSEKILYKLDLLKLNVPFFGQFIKKSIISKLTRMLYIIVSGGVPLLKALEIVSKSVKNKVIRDELKKITAGLKDGKNMSQILSNKFFPPLMVKIIAIGEESGELDEMFDKVASFYEKEIEIFNERYLKLLEPILIIILSLFVSFIVISIISTMMDVYNFI